MPGTAAVVIADVLFILLAIPGIASFAGREEARKLFNVVLIMLSVRMIFSEMKKSNVKITEKS
jgi:heme O synthase-like polyprenyltransferase